MALLLGTDIIEIDRVDRAIQRHGERFLRKLFTEFEIEYCQRFQHSSRNFAGRFAAKEAIAKALGTGFGEELAFRDIEIKNDPSGKPCVYLRGVKREDIALSISHCKAYAVATACAQSA